MITSPESRHDICRAMRWARQHHGTKLTVDTHRYESGQVLYSWTLTGSDDMVSVLTTRGRRPRVYATRGANRSQLQTTDTQRVLDVLVALGLLPREFSSIFREGQVYLATELLDARQTYEAVQRSGREVGQAVKL